MEYKIVKSNRKTMAIEIKNGTVIVKAPLMMTNSAINTFVNDNIKWIETHLAKSEAAKAKRDSVDKLTMDEVRELANKALEVIPERVRYYAPLVGVTYGRITIRNQHTKWGSCSSKGNLNFNCLLMLAPAEVLDSIVVHELCHRKEMNHSSKFYDEVLRVMPDYWDRYKWLKENGDTLMARMP